MKFISFFTFVFVLHAPSYLFAKTPAESNALLTQVRALQNKSLGFNELSLNGESTYELIESLSIQIIGDSSMTIALNTIPDPVEESNLGTTTNSAALDLALGAMDQMDYSSTPYSQQDRNEVKKIFAELAKTKAIYAWNPFGSASCGGSYSTVVIIDPETNKAYEFIFLNIEGC